MAGHNKWSKVKHKKGAADAKKSKLWTKIIREVTVAARIGGDDSGSNARLRKAIDDARLANMPKETLNRAITKGTSGQEGADWEELVYEGYGPGGVAVLAACMTDNRNRTSGDVRAVFNKRGGNFGAEGSVSFGFKKRGQMVFDKATGKTPGPTEDELLELGLDHGLEDVVTEGDQLVVSCDPSNFSQLLEVYEKNNLKPSSSELAMVPGNLVHVTGDNASSLLALIDALEDLDDVQHVWTNMDIDEAEMEKLAG